ncbi:hypothetical protein ACQRIU_000791 [Beauveria bassiana]
MQEQVQEVVAEAIHDEMSDEEKIDIMHKHGLRRTGGIDLLRFVINPKSFGQTVENMFYVSFLIRDGRIEIEYDEYDLPALAPVVREEHEDESKAHTLGLASMMPASKKEEHGGPSHRRHRTKETME